MEEPGQRAPFFRFEEGVRGRPSPELVEGVYDVRGPDGERICLLFLCSLLVRCLRPCDPDLRPAKAKRLKI